MPEVSPAQDIKTEPLELPPPGPALPPPPGPPHALVPNPPLPEEEYVLGTVNVANTVLPLFNEISELAVTDIVPLT